MDWKEEYKKRVYSPEEAVKKIKSNNRVVICHAAGEPQTLVDAMVKNYKEYENVEIVHMVPLGKCEYMKPEMAGHFRHNGLFLGGGTREAVSVGAGEYTPSFFFEIPKLFRKGGNLPVDVALIQVSLPDEHGYCSLGITCDYTKAAAENAKCVIAQVNKFMPRVLGDNFIHISEIDAIVEKDEPIIVLNPPKIGDVERKIGEYCASLINDGDTLQLGIGGIPDAVLTFLKDKKDLGIHSEMISDGVVDLVKAGVINNSKKTLHRGKSIVSFLMGTRKLYDYVDDNPSVEIYPVDYVNDPRVISKNDNIVSINSAIQVDLMGQVNAETIGTKQFSGTGGQVDFVRGTAFALNGKSIIAIPSTASKGKVSRITAYLDEGAAVTTSRNDVQYIITEYGIADLRGKTLRERAKELIKIAHPDFREELTQKALEKYKTL